MTRGKWDGSDLSGLSYDYLNAVLMRMEQHNRKSAKVCFGLLGEGVKPNYQIEGADGFFAYSSSNHERDQKSEEYEPKNLSKPYTFEELEAVAQLRPKSEGEARQLAWTFWKENEHRYARLGPAKWEILIKEVMSGKPVRPAFEALSRE